MFKYWDGLLSCFKISSLPFTFLKYGWWWYLPKSSRFFTWQCLASFYLTKTSRFCYLTKTSRFYYLTKSSIFYLTKTAGYLLDNDLRFFTWSASFPAKRGCTRWRMASRRRKRRCVSTSELLPSRKKIILKIFLFNTFLKRISKLNLFFRKGKLYSRSYVLEYTRNFWCGLDILFCVF